MTYEGITNFASLTNFDKKSIESIPTTCRENTLAIKNDPESDITAEPSITGANRSSIAICQFIVAVKADKYYTLIGRTMNTTNMHYSNVLSSFNIQWYTYEEPKKEDDTNVPVINDKENYCKVIKWVSIFTDCIS